jgi:hypothetical protein
MDRVWALIASSVPVGIVRVIVRGLQCNATANAAIVVTVAPHGANAPRRRRREYAKSWVDPISVFD